MTLNDRLSYLRISCFAVLVMAGFWLAAAGSVLATIMGDVPTTRAAAIGGAALPVDKRAVAMIGRNKDGSNSLLVQVINRMTGAVDPTTDPLKQLVVPLPSDLIFVKMIYSGVYSPGSVLVLDSSFNVHVFTIVFDADNNPKLYGTSVLGPYLDPTVVGAPTALAEAPNTFDPKFPYLAIGTSAGELILVTPLISPKGDPITTTPILDLAAIPQVGNFAFAALTTDKLYGNRLIGVNPDTDPYTDKLQPGIIFNLPLAPLAEPRPDPILQGLSGMVFEPNDEPLTDPAQVSLVSVNGTTSLFRLGIPENPGQGSGVQFQRLGPVQVPIVQAAVGSLVLVPADGAGALYDPGFNISTGCISGTLLTIYGNSLELFPKTLKRYSIGKWVTAVLEGVGNEILFGGALQIDLSSLVLQIGTGSVASSNQFTPVAGDTDSDGNTDLTMKFDRAAVAALIPDGAASVIGTLKFKYIDGSSGSASAAIRVIR